MPGLATCLLRARSVPDSEPEETRQGPCLLLLPLAVVQGDGVRIFEGCKGVVVPPGTQPDCEQGDRRGENKFPVSRGYRAAACGT